MPLKTVEPTRLYRQIAGQIASLIDAGEFPAGTRLPPERELAAALGVSRTSVREAVISLELAGRVEVRVGSGIFVLPKPESASTGSIDPAAGADAGPGPFELLSARALIEGEVAALAARGIAKADVAALAESIARMREHDDAVAERNAADRAFHLGIAQATGNEALVLAVAHLWDLRRGELWTKTEEHFHTPALRARTLADHEAIVAALAAHDAAGAREAMRRHLSRVAHEFQRRVDREPRRSPSKEATEKGARRSRVAA